MNSVGDYLRSAREERKIPLVQVSRDTKISERYLRAIEEGGFSSLPAPAYAKGFIKIYAEYLELDPVPILEQFLQEHVGFSKQAFSIEGDMMATNLMAIPWKHTLLGIGSAIIIAVVAISFITLWRSCSRPPIAESQERAEELDTLPLPPLPAVEAEIEHDVEETLAESAGEQKMKLVVRAKRDKSWMKVFVDKVLLFEGTIPRGKEEFWLADERIHLRMGNPEAMELLLDGKPVKLPPGQKERNLIVEKGGNITFYKGKMRED